jgi:ACDE family multidrug resistance protein
MNRNKNVRWFYVYRVFTLNHFITAIYVIYLRSLGCSFVTIASLHLAKDLTSAILELPLSLISDRIGHKIVLAIPGACTILTMLLMLLNPTQLMLYLAFILWGIAVAADSGISDAYLFESVGERNFPKVQSNSYAARQFFGALFKFVGSFTYALSTPIPFCLTCVNSTISTISSFSLEKFNVRVKKSFFSFQAIKKSIASKDFIAVIAHNTFLIALLGISFTYESVILVDRGLKIEYLGIVGLVKLLFSSFGSSIAKKISYLKDVSILYIGIYLISSVAILILAQTNSYIISLVALIFLSIVNGIMLPYKTILLNKVVKNDRATLLSVQAQTSLILRSIGALFIGWIADSFSTERALTVLSILIATSILFVTSIFRNRINGIIQKTVEGAKPLEE